MMQAPCLLGAARVGNRRSVSVRERASELGLVIAADIRDTHMAASKPHGSDEGSERAGQRVGESLDSPHHDVDRPASIDPGSTAFGIGGRLTRYGLGYVIAVAACAAAVAVRWLLNPVLEHRLPFIMQYAAVAIAIWFGGYRPALLGAIVGFIADHLIFVETEPHSPLSITRLGGFAAMAVYFASCLIIVGFGEALHRARHRLEQKQANLEAEFLRRARIEAELELIASRTPLLLTRCSKDMRFVFVNRACAEFFGRPSEEIIGRPIVEIMGAEAFAAIQPYVERVLRGEQVEFEQAIRYAHPGPRFMQVAYTPDCDEHGRVIGWLATISDVTERKQAEVALRESQTAELARRKELELIIEAAPAAIWLTHDPNCLTVTGNAAAAALLRMPAGANVSKSVPRHELLGHFDIYRDGRLLPADELPMQTAARTGQPVPNQELEFRFPDGSSSWAFGNALPLFDSAGAVRGVISTFVDISEHKRAIAALGESETRFRHVANSIPALAWTAEPDGAISWFNDRWYEYTGTTPDQMKDWGWQSVHDPKTCPGVIERWKHSIDTGDPFEAEFSLRGVDGQFRWFLARAEAVRNARGEIVQWFATSVDVTDRREAQAALGEADRRKDEFLAILAHELRNPLAPIRSAIELLKLKGSPDPNLPRIRDVIDRQVAHMARLLDDLLDVSRITRSRMELRRQRVRLDEVVEAAVETSRPVVEGGRHELAIALPAEPIYLDADLVRLAQVFSNLLNNAAKYTERAGRIELSAERRENEVRVSVKDNGIGIAPDKLPHVFDMFAQVVPGLHGKHDGLGIGLALVRGLVELHHGQVEAQSAGLGRGSEFIVRLPILLEAPDEQSTEIDDRGEAALEKFRILVADDLRDSADTMATVLRELGHETTTAYDGAQAIDVAPEFRPDVVLLDIGMPKLDGYEVCRRLRKQDWSKRVFFVAITGWGQDADRARTQSAGFDRHLVKPVSIADLVRALAAATESRHRGPERDLP
jgi:PAS domain S-box-containing protein